MVRVDSSVLCQNMPTGWMDVCVCVCVCVCLFGVYVPILCYLHAERRMISSLSLLHHSHG